MLINSLVSKIKGTRQGNMIEIFRKNSMHMTLKSSTSRELSTLIWTVKQPNCAKVAFMTESHNHFSLTLGDPLCPILLISIGITYPGPR